MEFSDRIDRILSESLNESLNNYIILTVDTYVEPGYNDSGWRKVKFFVKTRDWTVAKEAVKLWLHRTEVSKIAGMKQVGQTNTVPEGVHDNVMDEYGDYIKPNARNSHTYT